ncbi:MAG: DUF4465 domain-containing protein [Desulforegulaceae bacterium]|nr:DUF4465 domain-containing protein [Desulforegulaceae bacterium]
MKKIALILTGLIFFGLKPVFALDVCTFESFFAEDDTHLESKEIKNFKVSDLTFSYEGTDWGGGMFSWTGFAWSSHRDTFTKGYDNQYSAITKYGFDKSDVYCIAYPGSEDFILMDTESEISGFYITNTTYAYYSMFEGDDFCKRFGGDSGADPDFFKLVVEGYNSSNSKTGEVHFYLADFRNSDNSKDYIVKDWKWLDLSSLGKVKKLKFLLSSSDNGDFGMNTPGYFAMDNLNGEISSGSDDDDFISCFISGISNKADKEVFFLAGLVFVFLAGLSLKREKNEN